MSPVLRKVALLVVCGVALTTTACSNNKGKIEGKWKATSLPDMPLVGVEVVLEFTGNRMVMSAQVLGQKRELMSADYSLGSGDTVFFTNMKPPPKDGKAKSKDKITITGDNMTIEGEQGKTMSFTRLKDGEAAAAK